MKIAIDFILLMMICHEKVVISVESFGTLKLNIATSENILNDFGNINYEILAEIYDFIPDDDRNNWFKL